MSNRILVTHPAYSRLLEAFDPICLHSEYAMVDQFSLEATNVLRIVHSTGEVSMVVLGEGYTVTTMDS